MKSSIVKRSVIIGGHKTSISLEKPFWDGVREIADLRRTSVSALLQEIDSSRDNANLSSAIRVFVFEHFRTVAPGPRRHEGGHIPQTYLGDDAPVLC